MDSKQSNEKLVGNYQGYLDFPRIHFYGRWYCNPGTNNNAQDYYAAATKLDYDRFEKEVNDKLYPHSYATWNQFGDMNWSFGDCGITCVYDYNNETKEIIKDTKTYSNFEINPSSSGISGRIVDLDAEMQLISRIYGFSIAFCDKKNNNKKLFEGSIKPVSFQNMWWNCVNGVQTGGFASDWTSVIENVKFSNDINKNDHGALYKLKEYSESSHGGNKLQIKFITDTYGKLSCYANDEPNPYFGSGRVFGVIGKYTNEMDNPRKTVQYGRFLNNGKPGMMDITVGCMQSQWITIKYDNENKILHCDLSNCFPCYKYGVPTSGIEKNDDGKEDDDPYTVASELRTGLAKIFDVGDIKICQIVDKDTNKPIHSSVIIPSEQYTNENKFKQNCGIFSFANIEFKNVRKDFYDVPLVVEFDEKKINKINKIAQQLHKQPPKKPQYPSMNLVSKCVESDNGYYILSQNLQIRLGMC